MYVTGRRSRRSIKESYGFVKDLKSESWNDAFPSFPMIATLSAFAPRGDVPRESMPPMTIFAPFSSSTYSPAIPGTVPGSVSANSESSPLLNTSVTAAALDCTNIVAGPLNLRNSCTSQSRSYKQGGGEGSYTLCHPISHVSTTLSPPTALSRRPSTPLTHAPSSPTPRPPPTAVSGPAVAAHCAGDGRVWGVRR